MERKYTDRARFLPHRAAPAGALLIALLVGLAFAPRARADIFQWEYIDPANPALGKKQGTTLCVDGAGVAAFPGTAIAKRNLTMAYLSDADLTGAYAQATNFTNAELSRANLTKANFDPYFESTSNLTGANLSQANLTGASFYIAKLTGANMAGAEVRGAVSTPRSATRPA